MTTSSSNWPAVAVSVTVKNDQQSVSVDEMIDSILR
jgi:hypothetical protein